MARAKNEEFNQIKYQNEFKKANYDRVEIIVKKGERAIIKEIAAAPQVDSLPLHPQRSAPPYSGTVPTVLPTVP